MRVEDLESYRDRRTILGAPDMTMTEAAARMAEANIGFLPVIEGDRLAGVVSERDVMNRVVAKGLDPNSVRVREAMTADPQTARPEDDLSKVAQIMQAGGFRHVPIVHADGRYQGVVSQRDVVSFSLADAAAMALKMNATRANRFRQFVFIGAGAVVYAMIMALIAF